MNPPGDGAGCTHGHDGLAAELRALTLLALDRLDPVLARLRDAASGGQGPDAAAGVCPLCAVTATVRGERTDVAGRLADHATGLVAALRDALAEAGAAAAPPPTAQPPTAGPPTAQPPTAQPPTAPPPTAQPPAAGPPTAGAPIRVVQRIPVEREPRAGGAPC